jgi:hypothetical protein
MDERRRSRRIDVDLDGTVRFQPDNGARSCVIRNINEECAGLMIATSDSRVSAMGNLNIDIFLPAYRSPIKCTGRITWCSEGEHSLANDTAYTAGIYITDISRIDRRKLELLVVGRREPFGSGSKYSLH